MRPHRSLLCAMFLAVYINLALGQDKKSPPAAAGKPPKSAPVTAPHLKPLAPAQLFARGFEYFREGKYADAEELFIEGLKRDNNDYRAWEVLARVQAALEKESRAQHSLSEAVKRGLPKANEERLREDIEHFFPQELPEAAKSCLSSEVQDALKKIRVPRPQRAFEERYFLRTGPSDFALTREEWRPKGGGFDVTVITGDQPRQQVAAGLAGLVPCNPLGPVVKSLNISGTVFPLKPGSRFTIETYVTYGLVGFPIRATCDIRDTRPADLQTIPGHPPEGTFVPIACDTGSRRYELVYSSFLRLFFAVEPKGTKGYELSITR